MENNPCFLCQKDNKRCDFQRPCSECKKRGTPHMCMGIEIEARSQRHIENQRLAREKAYATAAPPLAVPVGPGVANLAQNTYIPHATPAASSIAQPAHVSDVPPLPLPKLNKKKRKRLPNEVPPSSTAPGVTQTDLAGRPYAPASIGIPPQQPAAVPPASQPPTHEEQMKINYFLLSELRKTKEEQLKMARELQVVKLENHKLHTKMAQAAEGYRLLQMAFRQMHPNYGLSPGAIKLPHTVEAIGAASNSPMQALTTTSANPLPSQVSHDKAFAGWMSEKAMVVFDLSKNPAVVLTCNDAFCQLFGYAMENVIGMAWKKFIHPSYFERTMTILLQNNGAGNQQQASIQFIQVYKNANGSTFVSLDTHTFFYGTSGPRADLVTITPVSSALPETTDLFFWPVTETATPLPTSPRPIVTSPHSPSNVSSSASTAPAAMSSSYESHHSVGSASAQTFPGATARAADDQFETVAPPVRRRKKSLNDTGGPSFVQVEELTSPEEIYRNAAPAGGAYNSTTLSPPHAAAKARKPRQPKPKAASVASSSSLAANNTVIVRRAGGTKSRRNDTAANRDLQSQVRIEEIPMDEITVPTYPPDIQANTPNPDEVLAATAAAIAAEQQQQLQQQQQQQQHQSQISVDGMSVDPPQISPGQEAVLFSDPEMQAMFGLPSFDSGPQVDLSSVGLDTNVGGEQFSDSFFSSDLPF